MNSLFHFHHRTYPVELGLIILCLWVLALTGCSSGQPAKKLNPISVDLYSDILGEERNIYIWTPEDEFSQYYGPARYPVIFVLDGESMFEYVTAVVEFLSMEKRNDLLPKAIVVGIPNTHRTRDLTPDPIPGEPSSGEGRLFLDFLEQELLPFIDNQYPTVEHRTLIGHSYGGLFSLYSFFNRPELFDQYIALDPSYQYLKDRNVNTSASKFGNKHLFIGIANTLGPGESPNDYKRTPNSQHFEELMRLSKELASDSLRSFGFEYRYYQDEDHASICVPAVDDAFRTQFDWYDFDEGDLEGVFDVKQEVDEQLALVAQKYGEGNWVDEQWVNRIAWTKPVKDAGLTAHYLQLNLQQYPRSFNAHFSLGNYYQTRGQRDSAILYLQTALQIVDDPMARTMLLELQERQ